MVTEQSLYWILRRRIEEYLREGEVAFQSDHKTQDAVIRNFEVIGEAAKRVLAEYRARHAEIPWQLMAGFRDVLIHAYEAAGPFCLRGMLAVPAGRAC
ncbi:MAG: DUF86 domain-containing protein [Planctomycetes bacterium]|nr:DUF86 domain-containing protein [Planctomycetota bacterium]